MRRSNSPYLHTAQRWCPAVQTLWKSITPSLTHWNGRMVEWNKGTSSLPCSPHTIRLQEELLPFHAMPRNHAPNPSTNGCFNQRSISLLNAQGNYFECKRMDWVSTPISAREVLFQPRNWLSSRGFRNPRLKLASSLKTISQDEWSIISVPTAGENHALIPLKYPEFNKT